MNNIGARFSLAVGLCGILFSALLLYVTWASARAQTDKMMDEQARLALEFETTIRDTLRIPSARNCSRDRDDEFIVEAMSTSYVARQIMEEVRSEFPNYILKFSSDNPRNPVNQAGPAELEMLEYFRQNPGENRWQGKLKIDGEEYLVHLHAMRIEDSCLRCHGDPQNSPQIVVGSVSWQWWFLSPGR